MKIARTQTCKVAENQMNCCNVQLQWQLHTAKMGAELFKFFFLCTIYIYTVKQTGKENSYYLVLPTSSKKWNLCLSAKGVSTLLLRDCKTMNNDWFVSGEDIIYYYQIALLVVDKSRYFTITEFNNCFISRLPSLFSYFNHSLTVWGSDLPFFTQEHAYL